MTSSHEGCITDLDRRSKIHDLVVDFHREVVFDDILGPVFGDVAELDWAEHAPRLISYWCQVLLGEPGYSGFVLGPHRAIHELNAFDVVHFDRWYTLWSCCIDARWSGPIAQRAKLHAEAIVAVLVRRLLQVEWEPQQTTSTLRPVLPRPYADQKDPAHTTSVDELRGD